MSEATSPRPASSPPRQSWSVRSAGPGDIAGIASAVGELLIELGASPPPSEAMQDATRTIVEHPDAGALLLAEVDREIIGMLGASWQNAVRVPGPYGLIQELWVHPRWRSQAIGAALLEALFERARGLGVTRVEVGLPGEGFSHLAATEAFYLNNAFTRNGVRMRRLL
jgi:GNAT superfamily N-acetyltransferase